MQTTAQLPWIDSQTFMQHQDVWVEIGYEQYAQMIECVPPAAGGYGYCLSGEPMYHDGEGRPVFLAVKEVVNRYYGRLMTYRQFCTEQGRGKNITLGQEG